MSGCLCFSDEGRAPAVRALFVPGDGPPEVVSLVGRGGAGFIWVNENGGSAGKPVNRAATRVGRDFGVGFDVLGNAVITGVDDDAEGRTDLSAEQVDMIRRRIAASG